jgi:hypothetical protein
MVTPRRYPDWKMMRGSTGVFAFGWLQGRKNIESFLNDQLFQKPLPATNFSSKIWS